ncbi:hypothetical protein [Dysgonomonas sp.]|jgi:hypothetical protein|uniref:hypothetical protein n=1 Tax=Dysgonomonas sp. TaxID=1891233 RepID=UPI002C245F4F|nr:hypothetical protein [Dysgonomonas sp.]HMM05032.1 hypothetical protein [Dysgonomonas sp.]
MKKLFLFAILLTTTFMCFAQDQTVNGTILQNVNNQTLSPARIQIGRPNNNIIKDMAVIGVTNGNLHLDSYAGFGLYLNYLQEGSSAGNRGMMINTKGYVGIGTNIPNSKLVIYNDNVQYGITLDGSTGLGCLGFNRNVTDGKIFNDAISAWQFTARNERFSLEGFNGVVFSPFNILKNGFVGIGTITPSSQLEVNGAIQGKQLDINGTIRSKEVKIEATGWSDFVFDKNYKLPTLSEVESHINKYKHLPDIPSEKEVLENGVNVVEMQAKLLQKIEELTLYVIDLKKENESIKQELKGLRKE